MISPFLVEFVSFNLSIHSPINYNFLLHTMHKINYTKVHCNGIKHDYGLLVMYIIPCQQILLTWTHMSNDIHELATVHNLNSIKGTIFQQGDTDILFILTQIHLLDTRFQ